MLNLDALRKLLTPRFQPFTIYLSDGRTFVVPHPDFIVIGRGSVRLHDLNGVAHTIDPLHIVSVEEGIDAGRQ